jgi:hypothetical protein
MDTKSEDTQRLTLRAGMAKIHRDNAAARRKPRGTWTESTDDERRIAAEEHDRAALMLEGLRTNDITELEAALAAYRGDAALGGDWLASALDGILVSARKGSRTGAV